MPWQNCTGTGSTMATYGITEQLVEERRRAICTNQGSEGSQHVTILMPVDDSSDVGQTVTEDGAAAGLPEFPPGSDSAVAVDSGCVSIDLVGLEPNAGDTTEDMGEELAVAFQGGQLPHVATTRLVAEALPAELHCDHGNALEESRMVDLGWGIVMGELSHQDFNDIMSFSKLQSDP